MQLVSSKGNAADGIKITEIIQNYTVVSCSK